MSSPHMDISPVQALTPCSWDIVTSGLVLHDLIHSVKVGTPTSSGHCQVRKGP